MCFHATHFQTFTAYNLPQGELRHTKLCILMHSLTALLRRNTPVEVTVWKRQEATVAKSFLQYKKYIYRFKKRKEKEKKVTSVPIKKEKKKSRLYLSRPHSHQDFLAFSSPTHTQFQALPLDSSPSLSLSFFHN